jgi:hypothetical protein
VPTYIHENKMRTKKNMFDIQSVLTQSNKNIE